jgi:hypothetical protein
MLDVPVSRADDFHAGSLLIPNPRAAFSAAWELFVDRRFMRVTYVAHTLSRAGARESQLRARLPLVPAFQRVAEPGNLPPSFIDRPYPTVAYFFL